MPRPRTPRFQTLAECLTPELATKFWAKVQINGPSECWPWRTAEPNQYGTYSVFRLGRSMNAHRIALSLSTNSAVPDGVLVLHSCDNPPCCNPAHLRTGTAKENSQDMIDRNRCRRASLASAFICACGDTKSSRATRCLVCEGKLSRDDKTPRRLPICLEEPNGIGAR